MEDETSDTGATKLYSRGHSAKETILIDKRKFGLGARSPLKYVVSISFYHAHPKSNEPLNVTEQEIWQVSELTLKKIQKILRPERFELSRFSPSGLESDTCFVRILLRDRRLP
jgi:hypothetical protein